MLASVSEVDGQLVFPVIDPSGRLLGIVDASILLETDALAGVQGAVAADLAGTPAWVSPDASLREAVDEARRLGLAQLPVCSDGVVVGLFTVDRAVRFHAQEQRSARPPHS